MPIVLNPEKDNTDWFSAGSNLGTAIFGSSADRANRDLRVAQANEAQAGAAQKQADARRLAAMADRTVGANQQMGNMAITIHNMRPPDPSEDPMAARQRIDNANAYFLQAYPGINPQEGAEALARNSATTYAQYPDQANKLTSLVIQGKTPDQNTSLTPIQASIVSGRIGQQERDKANIQARAEIDKANIQAGWERDRTAAQYGATGSGLKMNKDDVYFPKLPNGQYDTAHPIYGTAGGANAPDTLKSIPAGEERQLEERTLEDSYPGLTHRDSKNRLIISKQLGNSGLAADAQARARAAGEKAYKKRGDYGDYQDAYTKEIGHPKGTKFIDNPDPWFPDSIAGIPINPPYGTWSDAQSAANVQARRPDLAGQPAKPSPIAAAVVPPAAASTAAPAPTQTAAPAAQPPAKVASTIAQAVTPPVAGPRVAANVPTVTGDDDPAYVKLYPGQRYVAPNGAVMEKKGPAAAPNAPYKPASLPTEAVTVSASKTPAESAIAAAVTRPAQAPAQASGESNARPATVAPDDVRTRPTVSPVAKAVVSPPAYVPTQWDFTDLATAQQVAADPNPEIPAAQKRAASEAVARLQGIGPQTRPTVQQTRPTVRRPPKLPTHFTSYAQAKLYEASRDTTTALNAKNYITNANNGYYQ